MSVENITCDDLKAMVKKGEAEIIDIRENTEYNIVRMEGVKHIPMNKLVDRLDEIDWNKKVIFMCRTGWRSKHLARALAGNKNILNLNNGIYECYMDKECKKIEVIEELKVKEYFA